MRPLLFTTSTCTACKTAKMRLDNAGISYKVVDAFEQPDLAVRHDIKSVPTLVGESVRVTGIPSEVDLALLVDEQISNAGV